MTDELLDRVRAVDPLPEGSTAPPFESVFRQLADVPQHRGRQRPRRLLGLLVPAVSVAVAIGVMVAAVTLLHVGRHVRNGGRQAASGHSHTPNATAATTPVQGALVPAGGMSGVVTVWGAGFNSAGDGVISLQQCLRCEPNGNQTSHSTDTGWLVTTSDGGRSWTRSVRGYYVQRPLLAGQDGWAGGLQMVSRQQSGGAAEWEPGSGIARYFVTHDGGRSWSVAPSASPNGGGSSASVVGGEAWAVGLGSDESILHSPAAGERLSATASQPIQGGYNIGVVGAGAATAYVVNADVPRQAFVTHDDGRTWQRLTMPPCTGKYASARLDAAFGQTVWLTCVGGHDRTPRLVRSVDGGRSWRALSVDWGDDGPQQLAAVNARVAWALNGDGELLRTTNAGATWQPAWSATDALVSPLSRPITRLTASPLPILSVQSADSASIVTLINRGTTARAAKLTNLVVYRTTDGGQSWQTFPVRL
ncbi:MAG: hypothetical protein ACLP8S_23130 [Solirubrobacteraceae bacterium]